MTETGTRGHPRDVEVSTAGDCAPTADDAELTIEALYRDHAGFVWRVVRRMGVPEEAAEDAVQEVFIIARRKLPTYERRGAPTSWLYGIARGVVANLRRGKARAQRRLRVVPPPDAPHSPEEALQRQDAVRLVERFLATLPPDQRAVFVLADVEGMRGPDISRALRVGLNVVYSRLRLARRRFRRFLEERELLEEQQ